MFNINIKSNREVKQASEIFETIGDRNQPSLPLLTATQSHGMVYRDDFNSNIQYDKNTLNNYKMVLPGQFVIHLRSFQGGFAYSGIKGITSPAYTILNIKDRESHYPLYWKYVFKSDGFIRKLEEVTYGIRDGRSIDVHEFLNLELSFVDYTHQKYFGDFLEIVEQNITLKQSALQKLTQFKQAMLLKMFPKEGEREPEIRFEGFEGEWEKEHLSDLTSIVSGTGFAEEEQGGKSGTPFYKVSDMELNENKREMINSNNFVTNSQINKRGWKVIVDTPSIVIAKVGAALLKNRKRLVKKPFLIDNNMMSINLSKELDADFTLALFETLYLPKYAQTGALPSYNDSIIKKIIVRKPEMAEQKLIGNFFQALDQNIQAKQKELEKFKQFKKAMHQKMFV